MPQVQLRTYRREVPTTAKPGEVPESETEPQSRHDNEYVVTPYTCPSACVIQDKCMKLDTNTNRYVAYPEDSCFQELTEVYVAFQILSEKVVDRTVWELLVTYVQAERDRQTIYCPLPQRIRSVFLAACRRRADFLTNSKVWIAFFDYVTRRIAEKSLNPLYDSVFAAAGEWAPELQLLARDADAYARDIARADKFAAALAHRDSTVNAILFAKAFGCRIPKASSWSTTPGATAKIAPPMTGFRSSFCSTTSEFASP